MTPPTTEPTLEMCIEYLERYGARSQPEQDIHSAILRALRSPSPLRGAALGGPSTLGSAACDELANAIQWIKNIRDGVCDCESAMRDMDAAIQRVRALTRAEPLGAQMVEALIYAADRLTNDFGTGDGSCGDLERAELLRTIARGQS